MRGLYFLTGDIWFPEVLPHSGLKQPSHDRLAGYLRFEATQYSLELVFTKDQYHTLNLVDKF